MEKETENVSKEKTMEGVLEAYVELEVTDKDGKCTEIRRFKSKSLVANFLRWIRTAWESTVVTSCCVGSHTPSFAAAEIVDITGAARSQCLGESAGALPIHQVKADAAITTHGILVGAGTGAVTATQYALGSPIAHGIAAGQLSHGACSLEPITVNGLVVTLKIIRTFSNSSGDAITVTELGLFCYILSILAAALIRYTFMFTRDLIAGGVSVPNGSTLTLRYILTTTA